MQFLFSFFLVFLIFWAVRWPFHQLMSAHKYTISYCIWKKDVPNAMVIIGHSYVWTMGTIAPIDKICGAIAPQTFAPMEKFTLTVWPSILPSALKHTRNCTKLCLKCSGFAGTWSSAQTLLGSTVISQNPNWLGYLTPPLVLNHHPFCASFYSHPNSNSQNAKSLWL